MKPITLEFADHKGRDIVWIVKRDSHNHYYIRSRVCGEEIGNFKRVTLTNIVKIWED